MTIEPSPKVKKALKEFIDSGRLQKYPEYENLNERIAKYVGVNPSQIMITNGSDEGINVIMIAFIKDGDKVIIPTPSYVLYYQYAQIQGADILKPSYRENLSFPLEKVLDLINEEVKLVVVCNPNNPTGTAVSQEDVMKILKKAKDKNVVVLIDEAYFEFSGITSKNLIDEYNNLFITRTFGKPFGIASVRAGYILSQDKNIKELLKIRSPYSVNMFAKTAVLAALEDINYMKEYIEEVMEKSKPKIEKFLAEKGISFFPSAANFLFLKVSNPAEIIEKLKTKGILVRPKKGPDNKESIRISIGTLEDTKNFIRAFTEVLQNI